MPRLPFLLSIVHGGSTVPRELAPPRSDKNSADKLSPNSNSDKASVDKSAPRLAITPADIFYDSNSWSREVFSMGEQVQGRLEVEIARVIVDVDQDPNPIVPAPDGGVVKTLTRYNKRVWQGVGPGADDCERLIGRYHRNYHEILSRTAARGGVRMGIDCHSMSPYGAPLDPDPGALRPLFCVGNLGDEHGEGEGVSCSATYVKAMVECLQKEFADVECPDGVELVKVNSPLSGGYVLKHHRPELDATRRSASGGNATPWILLAFNRRLLIPDEDPVLCTSSKVVPDVPREAIAKLRVRIYTALLNFARRMLV